jgi:hypothetical protein
MQLLVDCVFSATVAVAAATVSVAVVADAITVAAVTVTIAAVGNGTTTNKPLAPSPPLVLQHLCAEIGVNYSCQDKQVPTTVMLVLQ